MKTFQKPAILLLAAVIIAFTSCDKVIQPSGNVTIEDHTFSGFDAIDISDAFTAFISLNADGESVRIEADDNIHQYIDVKMIGDRLYIGVEKNYNINGPATLRAIIGTNRTQEGLYISGASRMVVSDTLNAPRCRIEASGASQFEGTVNVSELSANASGASFMDFSGSAGDANVDLSGASNMRGFDFTVADLDIRLSGASVAEVKVDDAIIVNASGASTLRYKGDGVIVDSDISGASSVIHVE